MADKAFKDWMSLFTSDVENIWVGEREGLKKLAMLYHCFDMEVKSKKICFKCNIN